MLEHPTDKRAGIRKEVFLKGRQKNLEDFIVLIANIIASGRFWVKVDNDNSSMMLNILMDIADLLSSKIWHGRTQPRSNCYHDNNRQ